MDYEDGNNKINTKTPPELFDEFIQAGDLLETVTVFKTLCESLEINQRNYKTLYMSIKNGLTTWKAKTLWAKLDKRADHKEYKNKPCARNKVLIIGAGPCGLRSAIEAALLGAQVMVIEKRDRFSRNNVLHLWPYLINDLKNLGAKKFYGQFCAGSLDHISIKRLQLILLKVSLLFGVQVHPKCGFLKLIEPKEGHGWRAAFEPAGHALNKFEFDMVVGADGRRQALKFKGKEFRGKLAIGITVNFFNRNTKAEASVEEISGVAFIFNQGFFQDLKDSTGIELENIVYYKDETHYFVMCAKKQSLLKKGVIKKDLSDAYELLSAKNVNHDKLLTYAREAADFSTKHQLPHLDFALNHQHKEDVAMFDFTSLYAAEYSIKIYERKGYRLLATIVGDSLLEPFWPTGSGCARGFLGCLDAAWAQRSFGLGRQPLDIIAERESSFRLLAQTTPENLNKNYDMYSINPESRYPNYLKNAAKGRNLQHLYDHLEGPLDSTDGEEPMELTKPAEPVEPAVNVEMLLKWCQQQTKGYNHVDINDMSMSWKDGLAFCAILHHFRPDLINYSSLQPGNTEANCKMAFETAEEHLGIPPQISASEMAASPTPDPLMIVSYVSQYYESFKNETPVPIAKGPTIDKVKMSYKTKSPLSKLSILTRLSRKKEKRKSATAEPESAVTAKKTKHSKENEPPVQTTVPPKQETPPPRVPVDVGTSAKNAQLAVKTVKASNRISLLAEQVFGANTTTTKIPSLPVSGGDTSEHCFFCNRWIYLMERLSAEGHFFHRECFKCEVCLNTLRLGAYSYVPPWQSEDERAHFYCRPHYNKMMYQPAVEAKKRREDEETRSQKRHRKGKSVSGDSFPKETINALRQAADRKKEEERKKREPEVKPVSEEPQVKRKPEVDVAKGASSKPKDATPETPDKKERFKRQRSDSGRFRRLEARPLRRSSIASVRKSDKTVRDKGKGYTLDDGMGTTEDKTLLSPIKASSPKPSTQPKEKPSSAAERRKKTQKGSSVEEPSPDEKKGSFGRKTLDKFHRLGTLERKRRSRRAMYPPLSQVFSPEDSPVPGDMGDGLPLEASLRNVGLTVKKVDINIDDQPDKAAPTSNKKDNKHETPSKEAKSSSRVRPRPVGKISTPAKQASPKKQAATKQASPSKQAAATQASPSKQAAAKQASPSKQPLNKEKQTTQPTSAKKIDAKRISRPPSAIRLQKPARPESAEKGPQRTPRTRTLSTGSLVATRAARIRGLMDNDIRPAISNARKGSLDSNKDAEEGSPPEGRRTLPRVPSGEEPFSPTKASTKIAKRRPTGKPRVNTTEIERDVEERDIEERDGALRDGELRDVDDNKIEGDFVIVNYSDLPYGTPPPKPPRTLSLNTEPCRSPAEEPGDEDDVISESSEDDSTDWSNSSQLQRSGARRYKGKGKSDLPDERVKQAEQAKIRAAMKQRESKRLRQAQQIQRELQELEVKQAEVEKDGIEVEKAMRSGTLTSSEEQKEMMQWFKVINRKNALVRYESELVIHANSIQLEDQQGRLEQEIRELLMKEGSSEQDQVCIQLKTKELVDIVEQRNNLVELLDEDRKREQEEDRVFESMLAAKGFITSV